MSKSIDPALGKEGVTRREFVEGAVGTLVGAAALVGGASASTARAAQAAEVPAVTGSSAALTSPGSADYPPSLQGMRGQIQGMRAAHALRDGAGVPAAEDLDEHYDLVVVGAGMSGLAAAYFFRKALPNAKVLILESCDDFGGHARRNEFNVGGRQVISTGGAYQISFPATYTPEGKALLADIGVNGERYYQVAEASAKLTAQYPLGPSTFFNRETYGVDRLVDDAPDFTGTSSTSGDVAPHSSWAKYLARTPLSKAAKRDIQRLVDDRADHMPGLGVEEKIRRLRSQSYADYLSRTLNVGHDAMAYFQNQLGAGVFNVGAGPDSFSAWLAYNANYPGFAGLQLPPVHISGILRDDQMVPDIHLLDGNGGVARLLVRWLIPGSLPGNTMEDSVVSHVNYATLDRPENAVRIRLNGTVLRVQHDGDPTTAQSVHVTYTQEGKVRRVRAGTCVLACFNAVVPYLCPELPEEQKQALHRMVRKPLVITTVALTNWRAFAKSKTLIITAPNSFYYLNLLDQGFNIGGYRGSSSPDEPATVMMVHAPNFPGMPARDQFRAGRAAILQHTLEDFTHAAHDLLARALGPSGFDPKRDIAGVTVNLWAHGSACGDNDLYDPAGTLAESSWVKGRRRFGRITIANSDAAGVAMNQAAFDQANRAVKELLYDVIEPTFYFVAPSRG
jgi:spermidine dehydrogenase